VSIATDSRIRQQEMVPVSVNTIKKKKVPMRKAKNKWHPAIKKKKKLRGGRHLTVRKATSHICYSKKSPFSAKDKSAVPVRKGESVKCPFLKSMLLSTKREPNSNWVGRKKRPFPYAHQRAMKILGDSRFPNHETNGAGIFEKEKKKV